MCLCICVCSNFSLKLQDQWSQSVCGIKIGLARKVNWNDSSHLIDSGHLLFFIIVIPREGGAFSRDFTIILAPECKAFSVALKIEKLKTPLIPGPKGAVDTNDWCIRGWLRKWNLRSRHEKTCIRCFRPGSTQTRLYNHRRWLDAWNFKFREKMGCTFYVAKIKALISCAVTCTAFVYTYAKSRFSHDAAQFYLRSGSKLHWT